MSAIALLSLIGLALFLPALSSNDEDMADTPVDPEPPVEPEEREEPIISELPLDPEPDPEPRPLVNPGVEGVGTPEADRITTQSDASVFGREGNDIITANADGNGASGFGGEGEDLISITGSNINANGENDDDTFSVGGSDNTALGDSGDDFFDVDGTDATIRSGDGNDTISTGIDNAGGLLSGGNGNDEIGASGINTNARGDAGDDIIKYSAANGTASGGEGDDTLTGEAGDRGLLGTLFGNAGNDTLEKFDTFERGGALLLDGGADNDILSSTVLMTERSTETEADTLTGGEGSDTFNINLQFPKAGLSSGTINIATLTDFDPETEQLNITTDSIDEAGVAFRGLSLSQAEDGSFTDVIANYAALDEGGAQTQAVIRLEGVRDLDISRINLSTGDATTSGDDFISASRGEISGGAGDDLLITELFTPASELTVDTFTMGESEGTLQITSLFGSDGPADFGLVARVTDFSPNEDVIVIDTNPFGGTSAEGLGTSISLTEDAAEGATDVNIRLLDDAGSAVFNGIVRLEGVTGLSASDIALSLSEVLTIGPSYLFTATSEA